jgi:uncharacterized protein (DUF885 family)
MATVRELADQFDSAWNSAHPFEASYIGVLGFDNLVPDLSEEGESAWRAQLDWMLDDARSLQSDELTDSDRITLGCLIQFIDQELAIIDSAQAEHTVSSMPFNAPGEFFSVAARSSLPDPDAAGDYLDRLFRSGTWLNQVADRLRLGAAKGRLPVAALAADTIHWAEQLMSDPVPGPLAAPQPPPDWAGRNRWFDDRDGLIAETVKPAMANLVETLRELLPRCRPDEKAGLTNIPGGDADYERAIRIHTTLPLSAEEIHEQGLQHVAELEERELQLGACLGLRNLVSIHEAIRGSMGQLPAEESIDVAVDEVRRAESAAATVFAAPLPTACDVRAMPEAVALSGAAPHYSPPRADGSRPGIYWFNTLQPTAGTGWDLEVVTFHETVPGHHLQFGRIQQLRNLSDMQRNREMTVFSEGWGLYAERLAGEMGLYGTTESLLGEITASLMRAARLVVDSGLHALGWSRDQALAYFVAHVPMPLEFLAHEIDRYIVMPGQALAYYIGKLQILDARSRAEERLGASFSLPEFHSAILDSGCLPMTLLQDHIDRWVTSVGDNAGA